MLSGQKRKGVGVFLFVAIAAVANGAPTLSNNESEFSARTLSPASNAHSLSMSETSQITEPFNSHLATIAAEFLKPPVIFTDASDVDAKSLPAVPGALFMTLVGFLCVSLVRDRKVWMTALAGLLWIGQAGFAALPQLASHLTSKNQIRQQTALNLSKIPQNITSQLQNPLSLLPRASAQDRLLQKSRQTNNQFQILQLAIAKLPLLLIEPTNCLACRVKQPVVFSPAFVFDNLPRGPPNLA